MYRVLLIMPGEAGEPLDTGFEMQQIARLFKTEIVTPATLGRPVTAAEVVRLAFGDKTYDVIHLASHGSDEGVAMANGTVLSSDQLLRVAKAVRARLIFINTCSGGRIAQYLVDHGIPGVIASNYEQSDATAWSVAALFYETLSENGGDVYGAFRTAKPSDGTMTIWYNDLSLGTIWPIARHVETILDKSERTDGKLDRMQRDVESMQGRFNMLYRLQVTMWVILIMMFLMLLVDLHVHGVLARF